MRDLRILHVEDHAVFARTAREQFLGGHRVTLVASLAEARHRLATAEFDVLLVDFDLPDGKGSELVTELRASGDPRPIGAVSATGDGNRALRRAGASFTVAKKDFHRLGAVLAGLG